MMQLIHRITGWASSRKGAKIVVAAWLAAIVLLSGIAPSAKSVSISAGEGSVNENTLSEQARRLIKERFPSDDGAPALVVFHNPNGIGEDGRALVADFSKWLNSADKPELAGNALPYHLMPEAARDSLMSEDRTTLLYSFTMVPDLDSHDIHRTVEQVKEWLDRHALAGLRTEVTGPAGITADTLDLFRNADLVLLFATVGLILVLLIAIYRSPLLALIPLVVSGVVYEAANRLIGVGGKQGWYVVDSQALSIMLILLFAVLTDYCLFVFSRYREELRKPGDKHEAMKRAMSRVGEPILFSGGTVLVAMLVLLAAVFKPYHNFAPVFAIAMAAILLGGLTLIPAVFSLLGRKAFWPSAPKPEQEEGSRPRRTGIWGAIASAVVKRPAAIAGVLLALLLVVAANLGTVSYSFNLLKSFPEELSSRQGFELLERNFPKGELAPVTVLIASDSTMVLDEGSTVKLAALAEALERVEGVASVTPKIGPGTAASGASLPEGILSEDGKAIRLQITLSDNPYDREALNVVAELRRDAEDLLKDGGFEEGRYELHFAGQTAEQLDVRQMNKRDIAVVFTLITAAITAMLLLQTRSLRAALLMISTILLSYAAALGLGWAVFEHLLGYEAISYRIPVYTFVFLVALGVDYNIMLVSRIREEAGRHEWKEAIRLGVERTGGVISSAGVILAATFAVLITQPMQELFLFGLTMALGILLDTFLVRGMLLPSILALIGRKSKAAADSKTTIEV